MIRRIIVGLDGSGFSKTATEFACRQASVCGGTVVGMGIVDLPGIESVERGATIGSLYFAEKAEEHKLRDALETVQGFLADFQAVCKKFKVKCELHSEQGVPFKAIVAEGKVADLIAIGLRTFYHFETSSEPGDTLQQVLKHSVCPVIALPEKMENVESILIAYDGSTESAKTMRAFMTLFHESFKRLEFTVLTVVEGDRDTKSIQQEAASYLKCWDIEPQLVLGDGKVSEVILMHAKKLKNPIVVAGAHARSEISEFFFGSTTKSIIEDCTIPLLVSF